MDPSQSLRSVLVDVAFLTLVAFLAWSHAISETTIAFLLGGFATGRFGVKLHKESLAAMLPGTAAVAAAAGTGTSQRFPAVVAPPSSGDRPGGDRPSPPPPPPPPAVPTSSTLPTNPGRGKWSGPGGPRRALLPFLPRLAGGLLTYGPAAVALGYLAALLVGHRPARAALPVFPSSALAPPPGAR